MEESTKKRIHQLELIGAFILLLAAVVSFFPNPGITGYVSIETKSQAIDLVIANSQSYILTTNKEESFDLTSIKLSGEVIGKGIAEVYIFNKDQKILVYSNIVEKEKGLDTITGMDKITERVVGADSETEGDYLMIEHLENIETELREMTKDEKIVGGTFKGQCVDSCFITMSLNKDIAYQLLFYVEEGTILKINEIIYTIKRD